MNKCPCSGKHVPAPLRLIPLDRDGYDVVELCPTATVNLEHLLAEYDIAGGVPVGSITKHYGRLIRVLAKEIYFNSQQTG